MIQRLDPNMFNKIFWPLAVCCLLTGPARPQSFLPTPAAPATTPKIQSITDGGVPGAYDGYTLLNSNDWLNYGQTTILIDMQGNIVKQWDLIPFPAKMMPQGHMMGGLGYWSDAVHDDVVSLTEEDWDGNVLWGFSQWVDMGNGSMSSRQHHDFQREGNPVGYYAPGQDFVEHGKTLILSRQEISDPKISEKPLDDDVMYEVDWEGKQTGFIWRAAEHFDEMGFDWRAKHGIYKRPGPQGYLHINSMSRLGQNHWYDEGDERFHPDNIIFGSRHANIMAIIDHETGKLVWRIGPSYSPTTIEGRKIGQVIGPHNVHMIPAGLPGAGNILVFDNGGAGGYGFFGMPNAFRLYSRVIEYNPVTCELVWEYQHRKNGDYAPISQDYSERFFSYFISGAQRLPNGNTLITEGAEGRVFEVTQDGEIVWEYVDPYSLVAEPALPNNPDHLNPYERYMAYRMSLTFAMYRAYRIPPEWVPGNPLGYETWE
jgi:hypothetical protein